MGNTLEQYRAAIGCFGRCGKGISRSVLTKDTPDFEDVMENYGIQNGSSRFLLKGPWKYHAIALFCMLATIILTSLESSKLPSTRLEIELQISGVESIPSQRASLQMGSHDLLSTMLSSTCLKSLLIQGGVEQNPGPPAEDAREEKIAKQNTIIAELCVNAPSNEVRDCIRLYNPAKEYEHLNNKFKAQKKGTLVATLEYLGMPGQERFTIKECSHELVCTIGTYLPDVCRMCESEFTTKLGETPLMACEKCGQGIHTKCLLNHLQLPVEDSSITPSAMDIKQLINPTNLPGLRYLCGACDEELIPSQHPKRSVRQSVRAADAVSTQEEDEEDDNQTIHNSSQESLFISHIDVSTSPSFPLNKRRGNIDTSNTCKCHKTGMSKHGQSEQTNGVSEQSRPFSNTEDIPVCKFYRQNKCRHKNPKDCNYSHPRPCKKLMQHGTKEQRGCTLGKNCSSFHPIMCRESISRGVCLKEDCRKSHVKGTKRTPNLACKQSITEGICLDEKCKLTHMKGTIRTADQTDKPRVSFQTNPVMNHSNFLGELNCLKMEMLREMDRMITSRLGNLSMPSANPSFSDIVKHQCQVEKPEFFPMANRQTTVNPGSHHFLQTMQTH